MRVLGVDPSTAKPLGVALLNGESTVVEYSGLSALEEFYKLLVDKKPDLVVIEDQYLSFNFKTAKKLAWCAGQIMGMALVAGIPYKIINVAHWKSVMKCVPKDKKDKKAHVRKCQEIFNCEYQDDVASAILIALAYLTENSAHVTI